MSTADTDVRSLAAECAREAWEAAAKEHRAALKPSCEGFAWEALLDLVGGDRDAAFAAMDEWNDAQEEVYTELRA